MENEKETFLLEKKNEILLATDYKVINIIEEEALSTRTKIDGKFSFNNVPCGKYHLYLFYNTKFAVAYWFDPIDLSKDFSVELTNYNSSNDLFYVLDDKLKSLLDED